MTKRIAIVSDCGGQAMGRMMLRTLSLFPAAQVVPFVCDSLAAASGNIVDAVDAGAEIVLCNSAPRKDARETNGDAIVYTDVNGALIVSTIGALGLWHKFVPDFHVQEVNIEAFMTAHGASRSRFNFRGLEVIPLLAQVLAGGANLTELTRRVHVPQLTELPGPHRIWLVDEIGGKPTNLKTTALRSEMDDFAPGRQAKVFFGSPGPAAAVMARTITCYERLTDIPPGELGLYEGSSGLGDKRFLEIAMMGGSVAKLYNIEYGDTLPCCIVIKNDPEEPPSRW